MKKLLNLPALIATTVLANLLLIWLGTNTIGTPMGDLSFAYQPWSEQVLDQNILLGISSPWVYPYPALVPILLSALLSPGNLAAAWLAINLGATLVALVLLVQFGRDRENSPSIQARIIAGYAFVGFGFALGPVSISRIDSFSVLLALFGALLVALHSKRAAAALFTLAAWIKIWPIALFAPLLLDRKNAVRNLGVGAGISAAFVSLALFLGGNGSILSFASGQIQRGLQIESPAAMPWLWAGTLGSSDSGIIFNQNLLTFEAFGPGIDWVASLLGLVQLGAILITFGLGWLASQRGLTGDVIAWTSLTGVCDLIFFNKVGSPQFISWLAVPIVLGVLLRVERWHFASALVLLTSVCTWLVYPIFYDDILDGGIVGTSMLTMRNLLELALLVYANLRLTALATRKS